MLRKIFWMMQLLFIATALSFSSCAGYSDQYLGDANGSDSGSYVAADNPSYKIQAGDAIRIDVWRVPVLSQQVRVGMDGTFVYPLIGSVPAEGMTVDGLRTYLTDALGKDYLVDPVVTVTLEPGTQKFFVVGEVKQPGSFSIDEKIDVYQAVISAGGFTDFASKRVKILRKSSGGKQVIEINIDDFSKEGRTNPEAVIQPGDTVVVKKKLF